MAKPKCSTALIVVDMQPAYKVAVHASHKRGNVFKSTKQLIRQAVVDGLPIIYLEMDLNLIKTPKMKPTYAALLKVGANAAKVSIKKKTTADGSLQVVQACRDLRIRPSHFVLCGVNYGACVLATARGMRQLRPHSRLTVVREATNYHSYAEPLYEKINAETVSLYEG